MEKEPLLNNPKRASKYSFAIWLRVILGSILFILVGGIISGFSALKPILLKYGVFSNLCQNGEFSCDVQIVRLNLIFQITGGGVNLMAIGVGILCDKLSRRLGAFIFLAGIIIGLVLFGVSSNFREFDENFWWVPIGSYLLLAISGAGYFFSLMKYTYDLPEWRGQIGALLTCSWDLSASVFYFFQLVNEKFGLTLLQLFCGYAAIVFLPMSIFTWFITPPARQENVQIEANINNTEPSVVVETKEIQQTSVLKDILSMKMIICYVWMAASVLHSYFYLSTVYDQALWITNRDQNSTNLHNTVFSILLPAVGFGSNFIFGSLVKRIALSLSVLALLGAIFGICSCIMIPDLQYVTYAAFVPWRIFCFILLYAYIGSYFSGDRFATLSSIALTVAGASTLTSSLWNHLIVFTFQGNFLYVNIALTCLTVTITVVFAIFNWSMEYRK